MKKIKTINKLLSSLTLLSPLVGIGFNNQYQNTQKVITENTKNYLNTIEESEEQMGDVKVKVETDTESGYRKITGYVSESGSGALIVSDDIDEIGGYLAFASGANITSLDLSNATRLKILNANIFWDHKELTGNIAIPSSVTKIGAWAFYGTDITSLDLSQATSLTTIDSLAFGNCEYLKSFLPPPTSNKNFSLASNLGHKNQVLITGADGLWKDESVSAGSLAFGDIILPSTTNTISEHAFGSSRITSLDLSNATSLTTIGRFAFQSCLNLIGNIIIPSSITSIGQQAFLDVTLDNLYFLSETPPEFGSYWKPTTSGKIYVPYGTKNAYVSAQNFNFNSSQVVEWVFDSSSANIEGDFNEINILSSDVGNSNTFDVSGCTPQTLSQEIFNWSLIPTGETKTIPDGLWISKGQINWNNVAQGTYTFKIQSSFINWSKQSDQTITINVTGDTPIPPEPTPKKSYIPLILGLTIGLGIPVILAIAFIIWYLTKKKKTTVKI